MGFDAVVFDLDGTLLDTEAMWGAGIDRVLRRMGFDPSPDLLHSLVGVDHATSRGVLADALAGLDPDVLDTHLFNEMEAVEAKGIPLKVGVLELLDHLDRIAMPRAIATSTLKARAVTKLSLTGLDRRVATVVTFDCVARAKPAPDAFLLAAERLGVQPARCLAFEDSDAGTRAAHAAGMTVVQVPDLTPPGTNLAHFLASDLLTGARMAGLFG